MHMSKRFTGHEDHTITLAESVKFIKKYREHYGSEVMLGVHANNQANRNDFWKTSQLNGLWGSDDESQRSQR